MEDAEGNTREYKKLPVDTLPEPKEFKETTNNNEYMKQNGLKVVDGNWYALIKISLIILGIFCLAMTYLAYNNYFKTEIQCTEVTCPNCPACPTLNCPENVCSPTINCGDLIIPNSINVNVSNMSS